MEITFRKLLALGIAVGIALLLVIRGGVDCRLMFGLLGLLAPVFFIWFPEIGLTRGWYDRESHPLFVEICAWILLLLLAGLAVIGVAFGQPVPPVKG